MTAPLGVLLLLVPVLPLLLALPALHSRLYWPCHLALLPAVILLAVPATFSFELPWLLFGTGLGIDAESRLLLAMSVVLWAGAATLVLTPIGQPAGKRLKTFFLLTMAANLGAILATGLVGFFAFSTLMSFGFYGLLVDTGDEAARRAGRIYLGFMIVADLVLFDALLVAATNTGDLGYEAVHNALARSSASGFYVSMVLAGFALKAGAWPLHFWLPLAFRAAPAAIVLLLGGVPVAIGLVGMLRWLPLGELAFPETGMGIQWIALVAVIYGTVAGLLQARSRALLGYAVIVVTSLFIMILGHGLEWPATGAVIQETAHQFILTLGLTLAALVPASHLADKITSRLVLKPLQLAGAAAAALLLALAPLMSLSLARIPAAGDPLTADSTMVTLWPWWTLCTTLLALRWLYLLTQRQQPVVTIPAPMTGAVWSVLLAVAYTSGLLVAVCSDDPMSVVDDVWKPLLLGVLLGVSVWWLAVKNRVPLIPAVTPGDFWLILERWLGRGKRWAMSMGYQDLPRWRTSALAATHRLLQVRAWQKTLDASERSLQGWSLAVTVLLVLGIAIALLSA